MTRDDWYAYAESTPLTPDQRGAILGHCDRLGLTYRPERLAVLAELLELDELESTADLTLGQAGRLVNLLQRTRDRAELPDPAAAADDDDDGQDDEPDAGAGAVAKPVTLADALGKLALALWLIFGRAPEAADPADTLIEPRGTVSP